jgi:hypothetical protein
MGRGLQQQKKAKLQWPLSLYFPFKIRSNNQLISAQTLDICRTGISPCLLAPTSLCKLLQDHMLIFC